VINRLNGGHGGHMTSASEQPSPADSKLQSPAFSTPSAHAPPRDFQSLVRREIGFVWRVLRRLGLPKPDADDATQQVFLVASRKFAELEPGKERSFLYGTAVRIAANLRRGLQRRRETPADSELLDAVADARLPDELVEQRRARALLDELLEALPDELGRILVLAEIEELTVAAIAELEGIPAGTAASRLRRAREAFRKLLEQQRRHNPFEVPR
jgi:RNA polymerase sigma-70 factor (ECF subfamily)